MSTFRDDAIHVMRELRAERKINDLKAENEELRKELWVTNPLFETLNAANDRLIYENMKLRELVRDMWFGLYCPTEPTDGCSQCSFNKDGECFFEQRIRELGVEVDG